jgi:hypothetical protein
MTNGGTPPAPAPDEPPEPATERERQSGFSDKDDPQAPEGLGSNPERMLLGLLKQHPFFGLYKSCPSDTDIPKRAKVLFVLDVIFVALVLLLLLAVIAAVAYKTLGPFGFTSQPSPICHLTQTAVSGKTHEATFVCSG